MEQINTKRENSALEREVISNDNNKPDILDKILEVYYRPKSFEKSGKLYKTLGVKYIQKAVMGAIGKAFRKNGYGERADFYFIGKDKDLDSLRIYEKGTRIIEAVHSAGASWAAMNFMISKNDDYVNLIASGVGFLLNAGLIMLQRYNRARVDKAIRRAEAK